MARLVLEIRAGTGGDEAVIFANDLARMYERFVLVKGWKVAREGLLLKITGENVYDELKFEAGVHRVQRIPLTERRGRVHTSTASVAVLPDQEFKTIIIRPEDLRIDTFRASGAGGQHVNKTSSAVRVTHLPTGISVASQNQKSQHQNKELAMQSLKTKLREREQRRYEEAVASERRSQIGNAERSEKIRTYNFPQNRVTDHRLAKSWQNLDMILEGNIHKIIKALRAKAARESGKGGGTNG